MMVPLLSETCWSAFKYLVILIVSTYYILCIGWKIKCLITMDNKFQKSFFVPVTNMLLIYLFATMKLENGHEKD
jgi:hypothetical protein